MIDYDYLNNLDAAASLGSMMRNKRQTADYKRSIASAAGEMSKTRMQRDQIVDQARNPDISAALAYGRHQQLVGYRNSLARSERRPRPELRDNNLKVIAYAEANEFFHRLPSFIIEMLNARDTQTLRSRDEYFRLIQDFARIMPKQTPSVQVWECFWKGRLACLRKEVTYFEPEDTAPEKSSLSPALTFEAFMLKDGQRPNGEVFTREDVYNVMHDPVLKVSSLLF